LPDAVEQKESDTLFKTYATCADTTVAQYFGSAPVWALVFFPRANVVAGSD
jgi:hypothetical protein